MLADEAYCVAICDLLRPKELSLQLSPPPKPQTQVPLKTPDAKHGIADMLIQTESAVLLVEIKTELACGLTGNQDFGLDDTGRPKLKGYLQYLEYRQQKGYRIGLCVLAPRSWKHRGVIESQLGKLDIPHELKTWEEVCTRTANSQFGKFVREFGTFLESRFMSISFTDDESLLLTSDPGLAAFGSASVKLQELVKQAATELEARLTGGSAVKFNVSVPWGDATEYGAIVDREDKHVLWVGISAESNWPLVVSYEETWVHPDLNGLPEVKACEGWKAFGLPKECFTGEQPMFNLVKELVSVLLPRPSPTRFQK